MFFGFGARSVAQEKPYVSGLNFFRMPAAGMKVDDETAFTYSAFWACMKIISETIAYLPWRVYDGQNPRVPYSDHSLDRVLHRKPNEEHNAFVFKELMLQHAMGWGNFTAERERNGAGQTVALWPIDPSKAERDRDSKGRLVHVVSTGSTSVTLGAEDVFHVRGPSRDGINGYSVIQYARESISLGLAAEAYGGSWYGNGAIPGLVIMDKDGRAKLNEAGVKNLKKTWNENNKGPKNGNKVEYLDAGLDVKTLGLPPADSQFVESRKLSALDMCRWFRVPPHKLAELERTTHNNIESQNIEFVTDAIMPWTRRAEAEADFRLLDGPDAGRYYTKINVMGLLRGDTAARREWYKTMRELGVFTIDDVLEYEDMPTIGGEAGGMRILPANMTTVERMLTGGVANSEKGRRASDASHGSSMSALFDEVASRFCKIEISRVKKYNEKTSDNEIAGFYIEHARACASGFYRCSAVLCEQMEWDASKIEPSLQVFFGDWCATAADQIKNAIACGSLNAVMSAWEASRPQKLSRDLLMRLGETLNAK